MGNKLYCCDTYKTTRANEFIINVQKSPMGALQAEDCSQIDDLPSLGQSEVYSSQNTQNQARILTTLSSSESLQIKVINSGNLPKNTILNIGPVGLEGGLRQAYDGFTYFGSTRTLHGVTINDFIIPYTETETHEGRHFLIYYHIDNSTYYIRDLARGYGVFKRLDMAIKLKDNMLVNIGESFIVINLQVNSLILKIFNASVSGELWWFLSSEFSADRYDNQYITIGRNEVSTVEIEDFLLSKIECTIFFNGTSGWTLVDGSLLDHKPSTNGTWLYLNDDSEMYDGMIFKAHQTLFQVSLNKNLQ